MLLQNALLSQVVQLLLLTNHSQPAIAFSLRILINLLIQIESILHGLVQPVREQRIEKAGDADMTPDIYFFEADHIYSHFFFYEPLTLNTSQQIVALCPLGEIGRVEFFDVGCVGVVVFGGALGISELQGCSNADLLPVHLVFFLLLYGFLIACFC